MIPAAIVTLLTPGGKPDDRLLTKAEVLAILDVVLSRITCPACAKSKRAPKPVAATDSEP